jgi:hypothetical protein
MCNTQIEKSLNRKMRPRYLSPLVVIAHNFGGMYILCELDGSVLHHPVATFRLLPYLSRKLIPLPPNVFDIDDKHLDELQTTSDIDDDPEDNSFESDDT